MKMRVVFAGLALCGVLVAAAPVWALPIVPSNLIVVRNGNEWAWASPCAPEQPSCGNTLTMVDGFSVATAADFLADFTGFVDLSAAFSAGATCASAYFGSGYSHCDDVNVHPQYANVAVWNAPAIWGPNVQDSYSETFVVKNAGVPEPGSSFLLLGLGLAGLRAWRNRD